MTTSPSSIALRAYTEKPGTKSVGQKPQARALAEPSRWTVVFDTETTTDAAQTLRIGFYQVRDGQDLTEEGLFFDPDYLSGDDQREAIDYARAHGLTVLSTREFVDDVLLAYAYDLNGTVVGMNLPFDISRCAISHGAGRGTMRGGGFSFLMSPDTSKPRIRAKHLSSTAALIDFARPGKNETARSSRKRGKETPAHRGFFVDVKTAAAAMLSRSFSLEGLCAHLGVPTSKTATEEHGGPITADYLDYARGDVQATWECYDALKTRYEGFGLSTPLHKILSEASVGKAHLKDMGVEPMMACQDVPRGLLGTIMSTYFGGRAEVRQRRTKREILYCDFKSMYPTVNGLMGLWKFVIASEFTWKTTTEETAKFLDEIELGDLQKPETWQDLATLVRIIPDNDILPVRAQYDGKSNTIGLNHLSAEFPIWVTLADAITAKLIGGKSPRIIEAISFSPGPPQAGLKPIALLGNSQFEIDPEKTDFFIQAIDLRDAAKAEKNPDEIAIKIIANATSYGIFVEILRDNASKPELIHIYTPEGECVPTQMCALEEPGKYFHPLLATLITGAARLMLALAERITLDEGLEYVFCDTDSLAIARPDGITRDAFQQAGQRVVDWFEPLNPYEKPGSILQMEGENYLNGQPEPLYAYAISAKRYALFNLIDGVPVLRKASAHGLGHLLPPYGPDNPAPGVPDPVVPLHKIGVSRWQYDLWFKIIEAALGDHPERVPLDYHPALQAPAAQRYGASSPDLLAWMRHHNDDRVYADQVKPFGFMLTYTAKQGLYAPATAAVVVPARRGRPPKTVSVKPCAPFERDPGTGAASAFDRVTGKAVTVDQLKTYSDALTAYHLSPEAKFENGQAWDRGTTQRRHVQANAVDLIGKEANRVGEFGDMMQPNEPSTVTKKWTLKKEHESYRRY